jgi:hypothetical protein
LNAQQQQTLEVRDDFSLLLLQSGTFDTTAGEPEILPELRRADANGRQLHIVQFVGPVKDEWLETLRAE